MGIFDALIGAGSAAQAQQFNRTNYKHRYQWTAEDMEKAGLNRILAASQGGGQGPPAPMAQGGGGSSDILTALQAKLTNAQTRKTNAEATLAEKDIPLAELKNEMTAKAISWGRKTVKVTADAVSSHNTTKREANTARDAYRFREPSTGYEFRMPRIGRSRGGPQ